MKQIDRRKFLLGTGSGMMALPWLEMYAEDALTKKLKEPSLRFASFYSPMGFVRDHFFPEEGKQKFLAMPTLSPLKKWGEKSLSSLAWPVLMLEGSMYTINAVPVTCLQPILMAS